MKSIILLGVVLLGGVLLLVSSSDAGGSSSRTKNHPVIMIPGLGGSRLHAKLHGKRSSKLPCSKNSDEYTIWLDIKTIIKIDLPPFRNCVVDNMKLIYDNVTRTTSSVQGVTVSAPDLGDPSPVETLYTNDIFHNNLVSRYLFRGAQMFLDISQALQTPHFKRNVHIKGAPYDFRKAPNEHLEYFHNLKNLVEKTYHRNGNTSVVLIAHSMGGPMTLHFLHNQTQEWKDKYIKSLISLAASWGGSLKAMKNLIEGDNLDHWYISRKLFKEVLWTMPSVAWMLPSRKFWNETSVLVSTANRTYTINDMEQFFQDLGHPTLVEMYKDVLNYTADIGPPGVEVHCLYGITKKHTTLEQLRYNGKLGENPNHVLGKGDGTVNIRSLNGCRDWSETVNVTGVRDADHMGILRHEQVIEYIKRVVQGESDSIR